jgi:uncharacterized protein (TIGR02391 family)
MASKHKTVALKVAQLSFQQMQSFIPKIERRINDLKSLDVDSIAERSDSRIPALICELDDLLISMFGVDTVEYNRYKWKVTHIDTAPYSMMGPTPISDVRDGLREGIATSISVLESIKKGFQENLMDAGETMSGKTLKAYEGLELHPAIERAAGKLFRDGHYANAIEDAVKALNALVKLNSGIDDRDGTALMECVFNPKSPVLKFNSLSDDSDKDEQRGFMMLFSGAVAGLRNPRAHKIIQDEPEMALEFIAFTSLLAKLADKTSK